MSKQETGAAALRPDEFVVADEDPFACDLLGRQQQILSLCALIDDSPGPLVASVEGQHGSGKTSFLRMCAAHLRGNGTETVEFNAWRQGHTQEPLIDMIAAITLAHGGGVDWGSVQRVASRTFRNLVRVATSGLIDVPDSDTSSILEEWGQIDTAIESLRDEFANALSAAESRLVVFVDELDRCDPTYALGLLEKVRHVFDVPRVVVVLGINRDELEHTVESRYGPICDADGYLRRFVDLSVRLQPPRTEQWDRFIRDRFARLPTLDEQVGGRDHQVGALANALAVCTGGRLRDIDQIIRGFASAGATRYQSGGVQFLFALALVTLRYVDPDCHARLMSGRADVWEAAKAVGEVMRGRAASAGSDQFLTRVIDGVFLALPTGTDIPGDQEGFESEYKSRVSDDPEAAARAHEMVQAIRRQPFCDRLTMWELQDINQRLDLIEPT